MAMTKQTLLHEVLVTHAKVQGTMAEKMKAAALAAKASDQK